MSGIYVHIPFCKQKCSYCDFHFSTTYASYRDKMIRALVEEIEQRKEYLQGEVIQTIYFGGGTPSLLTYEELQSIIQAIYTNFEVKEDIEFTLEANPDDITESQLLAWKKLGVNRLSIGIQSFYAQDLKWMNRAHTVDEGEKALVLAKKHGFFITADLIYGLPNHTLEHLDFNLSKLISLSPEHISAYCLTVEKGTGLSHLIKTKQLPKVGEDEQAEEFEYLVQKLKKAGYEQYEISNFAKNKAFSVHNTNYWRGVYYIGIGPSAHSFNGTSRQWNIANNHLYIKGVLDTKEYFEVEMLSNTDKFNELILTGLRTIWGVSLNDLAAYHPFTLEFENHLHNFEKLNLIRVENGIIFLTDTGKLQADFIASELFV